MGIRFRKRLKLFPGVRANFSLSGASLTFGRPGVSISAGRRGTHLNLGTPGTGFSTRTKIGRGYQGSAYTGANFATPSSGSNSSTLSPISGYEWAWIVVILAALAGFAWAFLISDSRPNPDRNVAVEDKMPSTEARLDAETAASTPSIQPIMVATPPTKGTMISRDTIAQLQRGLAQLGFNPGPIDGVAGPQTVAAVKLYQLSQGIAATGVVDARLVGNVISEADLPR